jgi:hypothetical protein
VTEPELSIVEALAPVRNALLADARADAERLDARALGDAGRALAQAREQADRILAEARAAGAADAAEVVARERAQARRRARTVVLRARREAYEELVAAARTAVSHLRAEPGYAELSGHLAGAARRLLGPHTRVEEAGGGGVVASSGGRRLDLSLTGFADRAVGGIAARDAGAHEGSTRAAPRVAGEPAAQREVP